MRAKWILLLIIGACAPPPPRTVPRVVNGEVEEGPFVSAYAYEWFLAGEIASTKGAHDEAAIAYETALAAPNEDVLVLTRLAVEYEFCGESRRADRMLSRAARDYPESMYVPLARGHILQARQELEDATVAYREAHKLDPNAVEPVVALAELLHRSGHPLRARALLTEHLEFSQTQDSRAAAALLEELALASGDAEALANALVVTGQSARHAQGHRRAARLALRLEQPSLAARLMADSLANEQDRVSRVWALLAGGRSKEATRFILERGPALFGGRVRYAELLIEADEPRAALAALESEAPSAHVRYLRGEAQLKMGRYSLAANLLSSIPFGSADFDAARLALADCLSTQARFGAALEALSMVTERSVDVRSKLAELHLAKGNLQQALRQFDAKRPEERAALARVFESAGRYEEAAAFYSTAKTDASDAPTTRARAHAEKLAATGMRLEAVRVLQRWTRQAPEDLYARTRLVQLLRETGNETEAEKQATALLPLIADPTLRGQLEHSVAAR